MWYKVNILTLMNCSNWKLSLNKNFKELQILLQSTNIQCDVIAITETRITENTKTRVMENVSVTQNVGLSNYSFGHTPTESSAGGTPLYIANNVSYKTRSDLNIYKKFELDFCWNNQPKKKKNIEAWLLIVWIMLLCDVFLCQFAACFWGTLSWYELWETAIYSSYITNTLHICIKGPDDKTIVFCWSLQIHNYDKKYMLNFCKRIQTFPNPDFDFRNSDPKLFVLPENWYSWYLRRADSESGVRTSLLWSSLSFSSAD